MGKIIAFEPEKLVVGIMYCDAASYEAVLGALQARFGSVDCVTEEYSFSGYSTYYDEEMRGTVRKRFVSFRALVDPSTLAAIKRETNELEERLSVDGQRRVNVDPCLLSHGRFVMATTKGASFRVPLADGIYADLSLVYARGSWNDFFWTYADVRSERMKTFLTQVRKLYLQQRKTAD